MTFSISAPGDSSPKFRTPEQVHFGKMEMRESALVNVEIEKFKIYKGMIEGLDGQRIGPLGLECVLRAIRKAEYINANTHQRLDFMQDLRREPLRAKCVEAIKASARYYHFKSDEVSVTEDKPGLSYHLNPWAKDKCEGEVEITPDEQKQNFEYAAKFFGIDVNDLYQKS